MSRDPPDSWYKQTPLSRNAARYLWWGLANKTRSSYRTAVHSYTEFCALSRVTAFPATIQSLTGWVARLADHRIQVKTIKAYLCGVRSAHVDMGFEDLDVFHHPLLQRVIAGIRRLRGEADIKERRPITRDLLLQILTRFDTSTLESATLHASFCLAFAAFLRVGEFTWTEADLSDDFQHWHVTRRSVTLYEDYMELTLPSSKTDPFRRGITLSIAAANDAACPIRSLRNLFTRFPAGMASPLFHPGKAFTRQYVTTALKDTLRSFGHAGHYSGHSFRRGAATSARDAGLSDDEIQLLGRWKSDSYRLYIETHPAYILAASRRLQRSHPAPS